MEVMSSIVKPNQKHPYDRYCNQINGRKWFGLLTDIVFAKSTIGVTKYFLNENPVAFFGLSNSSLTKMIKYKQEITEKISLVI